MVTHSSILSGSAEKDIFSVITGNQSLLSDLGVSGFFVISGFLIYQSMERSKTFGGFFWKRFLRIYPALIVVLAITVLFGFFVYNGDMASYLSNKSVYKYVPYNLTLFKLQYSINGIFENNPYPGGAINGSLWTLQFEVLCYSIVSMFMFFKQKKPILITTFALFFIGYYLFNISGIDLNFLKLALRLGSYFFSGSLLAEFNFRVTKWTSILFICSVVLLSASVYFRIYADTARFTLPLMIIFAGLYPLKYLSGLSEKYGDFSYGVYIWAFPVQQSIVHFFKPGSSTLLISSFVITIILAAWSWHLVEKRVLVFKNIYK
jgi:peptidoglycan/LPS O-acetylase OafA/YrhL